MQMMSCDKDDELFLVDCGIESLSTVYLKLPDLKSLNVHSNNIARIDNLSSVVSLTRLDLSSNQITKIENLNSLKNLKYLNLSCNLIIAVEGLSSLSSLVTLNLAYNKIISLKGLLQLPNSKSLRTLQLQGNCLDDLSHITQCLQKLSSLSCLVLSDGLAASNPVCSMVNDYEKVLKHHIPSLVSTERPAPGDDSELSNPEILDSKALVVNTPHIDAVLNRFHKALDLRRMSPSTEPSSASSVSKEQTDVSSPVLKNNPASLPSGDETSDEERKILEVQLAVLQKQLLRKRIETAELELKQVKNTEPSCTFTDSSDEPVRDRPIKRKNASQKRSPPTKNGVPSSDAAHREAVQSTYKKLIEDLDAERSRRCKAEEAASKLAQQIKQMHAEANEKLLSVKNCDDVIKKQQKEISEMRDGLEQTQNLLKNTKLKLKESELEIKRLMKTCSLQEQSLSELEKVNARFEKLKADAEEKHTTEIDRLQKSLSEQSDLLRSSQSTVRSQRMELDDMKSLLAAREADHRRDIENRYLLDSPKLEELFQSKIANLIREHSDERKNYEFRMEKLAQEYRELEDEFRMALHIEAERFQSLKTSYEELSLNHAKQEQVHLAWKEKEVKANKVMADLTQLVKEQKEKLISLSKEKQDLGERLQNTKTKLEKEIFQLNEKLKDFERLKKDNIELKNQVQGQHSIIAGLRKERELWSKELAQQGAALSSERGGLEAKIEALTQENKALRSNLDTELDTVKIKAKLITDLTDTVGGLKKKVSDLEGENNKKESLLQSIKNEHLHELNEERANSASLEQDLGNLAKRKEELKLQLQAKEDELAEVKDAHKNLKIKWQEKSSSINAIEDQVKQMRSDWSEKEKKLIDERDKAVHAAEVALQKMRAADDGFRKQLEVKELSHANKMEEITQQYELRLAEELHRVETVEQEMREILMEKEISKKQFEERIKKITRAFQDLQQDM